MAVETWGVDQTRIQTDHPQLSITTSSPLTPARMAEIVKARAAKVNARLTTAGLTVADLVADTTADTYETGQALIVCLSAPHLWEAATPGDERIARLEEKADDEWAEYIADPAAYLGWVVTGEGGTSLTRSSTSRLGLATDTTSLRDRRQFDGRSRGVDTGGFTW